MSSTTSDESTDYRALLSEIRGLLVRNPDAAHVENARIRAESAAAHAPRREDRARFCQVLAQHYNNYALPQRSDHWLAEAERFSQGIPELEAKHQIVYGFFQEVLDQISFDELREELALAARAKVR